VAKDNAPYPTKRSAFIVILTSRSASADSSDPDQIFRKSTTFKLNSMTYSDKFIEDSLKNSISTVPIQPWGADDRGGTQKCADLVR
jgi:hypothetical protein